MHYMANVPHAPFPTPEETYQEYLVSRATRRRDDTWDHTSVQLRLLSVCIKCLVSRLRCWIHVILICFVHATLIVYWSGRVVLRFAVSQCRERRTRSSDPPACDTDGAVHSDRQSTKLSNLSLRSRFKMRYETKIVAMLQLTDPHSSTVEHGTGLRMRGDLRRLQVC